jgi:hypothetical protein
LKFSSVTADTQLGVFGLTSVRQPDSDKTEQKPTGHTDAKPQTLDGGVAWRLKQLAALQGLTGSGVPPVRPGPIEFRPQKPAEQIKNYLFLQTKPSQLHASWKPFFELRDLRQAPPPTPLRPRIIKSQENSGLRDIPLVAPVKPAGPSAAGLAASGLVASGLFPGASSAQVVPVAAPPITPLTAHAGLNTGAHQIARPAAPAALLARETNGPILVSPHLSGQFPTPALQNPNTASREMRAPTSVLAGIDIEDPGLQNHNRRQWMMAGAALVMTSAASAFWLFKRSAAANERELPAGWTVQPAIENRSFLLYTASLARSYSIKFPWSLDDGAAEWVVGYADDGNFRAYGIQVLSRKPYRYFLYRYAMRAAREGLKAQISSLGPAPEDGMLSVQIDVEAAQTRLWVGGEVVDMWNIASGQGRVYGFLAPQVSSQWAKSVEQEVIKASR